MKNIERLKADSSTHHPQIEVRSGPRSLRMTPKLSLGISGTPHQGVLTRFKTGLSIYGCVAGATFTAASLILAANAFNLIGQIGIAGAVIGCVTLLPVPTAYIEASPALQ